MRKLKKGSNCEMVNCNNIATDLVYSRNQEKVLLCCETHANEVVDERGSEYQHQCENCGCMSPIN